MIPALAADHIKIDVGHASAPRGVGHSEIVEVKMPIARGVVEHQSVGPCLACSRKAQHSYPIPLGMVGPCTSPDFPKPACDAHILNVLPRVSYCLCAVINRCAGSEKCEFYKHRRPFLRLP